MFQGRTGSGHSVRPGPGNCFSIMLPYPVSQYSSVDRSLIQGEDTQMPPVKSKKLCGGYYSIIYMSVCIHNYTTSESMVILKP